MMKIILSIALLFSLCCNLNANRGYKIKFTELPVDSVRVINLLPSRTCSEAIEEALKRASNETSFTVLILDQTDWLIDRSILLPSNTELLIDGCKLKLADGVFDNIVRSAGITPDSDNPNGICSSLTRTFNIKITGINNAVIEGADKPFCGINPKTGIAEPWVGDFFGWRTIGILLAATENYEISGFKMQKTHCWAISQEWGCKNGYIHDLEFNTNVKNGDGIDFRNGCSGCVAENISGSTSDDTVACTALDETLFTKSSRYIWPMQAMGFSYKKGNDADIHDIRIKNIFTTGKHHSVICLATSPSVYNIEISNIIESISSGRESCVKIYTGYGTGYKKGNLRNISVKNVRSMGATYGLQISAEVENLKTRRIRQFNKDGVAIHGM